MMSQAYTFRNCSHGMPPTSPGGPNPAADQEIPANVDKKALTPAQRMRKQLPGGPAPLPWAEHGGGHHALRLRRMCSRKAALIAVWYFSSVARNQASTSRSIRNVTWSLTGR